MINTYIFTAIFVLLSLIFCLSRLEIDKLPKLVIGATIIHELLLVIFPTIYSVLTDFKLEGKMINLVSSEDILMVITGECFFISMFLLGFIFSQKILIDNFFSKKKNYCCSDEIERLVINILILFGILTYLPKIFLTAELIDIGFIDQISWYLVGIFWYMPLVACAFVVTDRSELILNPIRVLFASIPLASVIIIGLNSGVRGRIIWIISLILIAAIYNVRKKFIYLTCVAMVLFLPIFSVLGDRDVRGLLSTSSSQIEVYTHLSDAISTSVSSPSEMTDAFLESFAWRAQGVRNSVSLYRDYEMGGGGFNTYIGSFFAFIPRVFWDVKPMLGSLDHTEFESAQYKVMSFSYDDPGTMGPFLASAHAYWEGGWIWLLLAGFITGLFWSFVFKISENLPVIISAVVIFSFSAALIIDGLLTIFTPLYAFIIRMWLSLLPMFLIYKLAKIFLDKKYC